MEPKDGVFLNFECSKGESVFYRPLSDVCTHLVVAQLQKEIDDDLQHVVSLNDDRLLALIADLLVENAVENYLLAIIPRYEKDLSKKVEFQSLSFKIAVAKALCLSPPRLFEGAAVVREVRNQFVHNLEIESFSNLPTGKQDKIDNILACYGEKTAKGKSLPEKFKTLTFLTILGLRIYIRHVQLLNSFLRDERFLNSLGDFCRNKKP